MYFSNITNYFLSRSTDISRTFKAYINIQFEQIFKMWCGRTWAGSYMMLDHVCLSPQRGEDFPPENPCLLITIIDLYIIIQISIDKTIKTLGNIKLSGLRKRNPLPFWPRRCAHRMRALFCRHHRPLGFCVSLRFVFRLELSLTHERE